MDHINEEILKSLLEGRMSRVAQAQVRHHIRTCFRCEQKLTEWRASFETLSEEPSDTPQRAKYNHPAGSEPTVLVPAKPIALSRHSRRVMKTVLAVAFVVVIALIIDSFRQGRQPEAAAGTSAPDLIAASEAALQEGVGPEGVVADSVTQDSTRADPAPALAPARTPVMTPAESAAVPPPSEGAPAPAPAARRSLAPAPGFSVITVREAIERKGGMLQLIRGLLPDHIEVADASAVPGALPGSEVFRVVYREPNGRVLRLDQQNIPPAYGAGLATDTLIDSEPGGNSIAVWVIGDTRLTLSGRMDPETLLVFVRRVD